MSENFIPTPKEVLESVIKQEGVKTPVEGFAWNQSFIGPRAELPVNEQARIEEILRKHKS